jgi:phenylalanyl-tRNA synthetase beta chain
MKTTYHWLKRHLNTEAPAADVIKTLNQLGLVVDDQVDYGATLKAFVIAEIKTCERHPNADRLALCTVFDGQSTLQIVCGAPNARAGIKVVLAKPGTTIPASGQVLKLGNIRGIESQGMLCSYAELGLSADHSGIIELPAEAPVGQPFAAVYGHDDVLLDLDIAPNRSDCLGAAGIARELATAGLGELTPSRLTVVTNAHVAAVSVTVDPETQAYGQWQRIVGIHNTGHLPSSMARLLTTVGGKTISPVVDITNFLCFDVAQPFHAFDAHKVQGAIKVRFATAGETFEALNGESYSLTPEMIVIADEAGVIALAGVIGGQRTACDAATTEIILECAYFDPLRIARTGRALNIVTDSRYRFERGTDAYQISAHLARAAALVQEICGGQAGAVTEAGGLPAKNPAFECAIEFITKRTGLAVPQARVVQILTSGGCEVAEGSAGRLRITPPTWRRDLAIAEDIVEEVLRFMSYDAIPVVRLPRTPVAITQDLPPEFVTQMATRQILAQRGLAEVVTWSFLSAAEAEMLGGAGPEMHLLNPISSDLAVMRPGLMTNLIKAAATNFNRTQNRVVMFEVGPQYGPQWHQGQTMVAAGLRGGVINSAHWAQSARVPDVFDVKADVWAVLKTLGVDADKAQFVTTEIPGWYHPGRAGIVRQGPQRVLAYFGQLHPAIAGQLGCDKPVVGFEIFLDQLPPVKWARDAKPWQVSPFQPVERDFSFVLPQGQAAEGVIKAISKVDPALITQVHIFDVYPLAEGAVALGVRVRLEPQGGTLTEADLQTLADKVIKTVNNQTGAVLRT